MELEAVIDRVALRVFEIKTEVAIMLFVHNQDIFVILPTRLPLRYCICVVISATIRLP